MTHCGPGERSPTTTRVRQGRHADSAATSLQSTAPLHRASGVVEQLLQMAHPRISCPMARRMDVSQLWYVSGVRAIITYMSVLPVADARAQLSRLIDEAATTHERFEITRNGRRAAVLLSADDYDTLQETIAVLSDAELLTTHHEGRAAIDDGDYLDADQLTHAMREAGRLPQ